MHKPTSEGFNFASPPPIAEKYTLETCSVSITEAASQRYGLMALRLGDSDEVKQQEASASDKKAHITIATISELGQDAQEVPEDAIATYVDVQYSNGVARLAVATSLTRQQTAKDIEEVFKADNDLDQEGFEQAVAEYERHTGEPVKGHMNFHAQHAMVHNFADKIDEYFSTTFHAHQLTEQESIRARGRLVRARTLLAVPPAVLGYQLLVGELEPGAIAFMATVALAVQAYDMQSERKNPPNYVEQIERSHLVGRKVLEEFHALFVAEE